MNPAMPVAGLREGSLLHIQDGTVTLKGRDMKLFRHGQATLTVLDGTSFRKDLTDLRP